MAVKTIHTSPTVRPTRCANPVRLEVAALSTSAAPVVTPAATDAKAAPRLPAAACQREPSRG
ncbi:MAG TPA: hypothetical protein VIR30_08790, partial [Nocardioides sp.]